MLSEQHRVMAIFGLPIYLFGTLRDKPSQPWRPVAYRAPVRARPPDWGLAFCKSHVGGSWRVAPCSGALARLPPRTCALGTLAP